MLKQCILKIDNPRTVLSTQDVFHIFGNLILHMTESLKANGNAWKMGRVGGLSEVTYGSTVPTPRHSPSQPLFVSPFLKNNSGGLFYLSDEVISFDQTARAGIEAVWLRESSVH